VCVCVFSRVVWLLYIEVTDHARSAMLHFYTPNTSVTPIDRAVKSFFVSSCPVILSVDLVLLR